MSPTQVRDVASTALGHFVSTSWGVKDVNLCLQIYIQIISEILVKDETHPFFYKLPAQIAETAFRCKLFLTNVKAFCQKCFELENFIEVMLLKILPRSQFEMRLELWFDQMADNIPSCGAYLGLTRMWVTSATCTLM